MFGCYVLSLHCAAFTPEQTAVRRALAQERVQPGVPQVLQRLPLRARRGTGRPAASATRTGPRTATRPSAREDGDGAGVGWPCPLGITMISQLRSSLPRSWLLGSAVYLLRFALLFRGCFAGCWESRVFPVL
jgi:hypothetical protein